MTNQLYERGVWGRAVPPHGKEVTGYVDPSARTLTVYSEDTSSPM